MKCMFADCFAPAAFFLTPEVSCLGVCNAHMHCEWAPAVQSVTDQADCDWTTWLMMATGGTPIRSLTTAEQAANLESLLV